MSHGNRREMSRTALAIAEVCRPTDHRCMVCLEPCAPGCDTCQRTSCIESALQMDASQWVADSVRAAGANEEMP